MQLPVEFSISCSIFDDLLVEIFDSGLAGSIGLNCLVDVGNEGVEVVHVFLGNFIVLSLVVSEPGYNFLLVKIEGEGVVARHVIPVLCALSGTSKGFCLKIDEGKS